MGILPISIGIGLLVSLLFTEIFGLAAGGLVVPGYIALNLNSPLNVLLTLSLGFLTFLIVRLISAVVIVYGRRRTTLMILVAYLLGMVFQSFPISFVATGEEIKIIGYIIPGLIAIWIDRQGVLETYSTLLTGAVIVRLILILIYGTEIKI